MKDKDYNLSLKLISDLSAASLAAMVAAPFVTIVDKLIIQQMTNSINIGKGIKNELKSLFLNPIKFIRRPEFLMVWGVYSLTYLTANCSDTLTENLNYSENNRQLIKLGSTTLANMSACILKDRAFTIKYGLNNASHFPISTYNLFFIRDIMSIGASFNLPNMMAENVSNKFNISKENAEVFSQFFLPGLFQFVSTPIHLLAIDYYNRPNIKFKNRINLINNSYNSAVSARIMRLTWSFGLGGITNNYFRKYFNRNLENFFL